MVVIVHDIGIQGGFVLALDVLTIFALALEHAIVFIAIPIPTIVPTYRMKTLEFALAFALQQIRIKFSLG